MSAWVWARRRAARGRRRDRALPARRRRSARARRASGFPLGTLAVNAERRAAAGPAQRAALTGERAGARRHRDARLLHHLLHLDARDPAPRRGRGRAAARCSTSCSASPSASPRPRSGARSERGCERGLPEAHDLLRRARPHPRAGCSPTSCSTSTARQRAAGKRAAARRRGLRAPAPPAHRPAAEPLRRPAVGLDRGRPPRADRGDCSSRVLQIKRRGLITLERARLLTGESGRVQLPEQLSEATKLTVYVGRQRARRGTPAFAAICELLHRRGHRRRERAARRRRHPQRTPRPRPVLQRQRERPDDDPRGRLRRADRAGSARARAPAARTAAHARARTRLQARRASCWPRRTSYPARDEHGLGAVAEADDLHLPERHPRGPPLQPRRSSGGCAKPTPPARPACAASGASTAITPPTATGSSRSAATSPSLTIVIDTPERIARSFEIVDELTAEHGLVTSEMVPAMTRISETETHGGLRLARHEF